MRGQLFKMKVLELKEKQGKKLIAKILEGPYLRGCTIAIIDGEEDIPESDIRRAIREMRGEKMDPLDWD